MVEQNTILKVSGLTKAYDGIRAVDDVSFSVGAGEIVGLLGPNGAGKTTTINMILGVLEPDAGTVSVIGVDAYKDHRKSMPYVNFAAVYAQMPGNLTVSQNLKIFGHLYGVQNLNERISRLIREFDLEKLADVRVGLLSSGEQTRAGLVKALINTPRLLLLDEPTASLDPSSANFIREKLRAYVDATQTAALWTSHNMYEVASVCNRVLFLSHGKILLEGNPKTLPEAHGKKDLEELFIAVAREPLLLNHII